MDAAEALLGDLESDGLYPDDFVVFRVTGYRPEGETSPADARRGEELRRDLAVLVRRLSEAIDLRVAETGREAIPIEEVAGRLGVSTRTVQRWRGRGLVVHAVRDEAAPESRRARRLVCFADALARFRAREGGLVARARAFSRVDAAQAETLIEEARRLAAEGVGLAEVARRLARSSGRAVPTIRAIVRRHDRRSEEPIFGAHGPLSERDLRTIERAFALGVRSGLIARRYGRTAQTIRRVADERLAARLRAAAPRWIAMPSLDYPDAEAVLLAAPALGQLPPTPPATADAVALAVRLAEAPDPEETTATALAAALNLLKRRAARELEAGGRRIAHGRLDRAAADLRHASKVKRGIVALALPVAARRIEQFLHRPIPAVPAEELVTLLRLALATASEVVDRFDPAAGHRLARLLAWETDRALAGRPEGSSRRAAARHAPGAVRLVGGLRRAHPWDDWLDLPPSLEARLGDLPAAEAALLRRHHGLGAAPPETAAAIGRATGRRAAQVTRDLRRARRALLAARRAAR